MAKRSQPVAETPSPAKTDTSSEYTVVARRYRPQQFSDLVGQEPVARALMNALQNGRVAHAYLFTGARGVGKTSTARILAKALNCVKGPTATPCDQCDLCLRIATGEDIDVLEIDGASNRGIDEVRAIRQNVTTRPSRSRYKIYIIDEVHMLTMPAFNALLKTLEEPPPHVKFIFATTEVQKIPITILSRCQRFDFAGIGANRIVEHLQNVVQGEGLHAEEEALRIVARRAGGSMRDAQSLLDQLLAFSSDKLTAIQVHQLLGTATDERVLELAAAIVQKDTKSALEMIQRCSDEGLQLGELLDQLIEYWRGLMLICSAGDTVHGLTVSESHRSTVIEQAKSFQLDTILAGLDVLTTAKSRLRFSSHSQILIEMAIVRLCRMEELLPISQITQWLTNPSTFSLATNTKPTGEPAKKNYLIAPSSNGTSHKAEPTPSVQSSDSTLEEIWRKVVQEVGPILGGHLEKAPLPAILGPNSLVIRYAARYTSQYDFTREPINIERVERTLRNLTQKPWTIRVDLESGTADSSQEPTTQTLGKTTRERQQEALQMPLLSKIVDTLGARLLILDDGFGETAPTETTVDEEASETSVEME